MKLNSLIFFWCLAVIASATSSQYLPLETEKTKLICKPINNSQIYTKVFFQEQLLDWNLQKNRTLYYSAPVQWEKPADKKIIAKLLRKITSRKKYLNRKANKYEAKAMRHLTNKNLTKAQIFSTKAREARNGFTELNRTEWELAQLGNSPIKFTFTYNEENISYTYMNLEGTIVIEFNSYVNAIHELAHAFQHLTGQIEYIAGTGGAKYIDLLDELKAYKRQYFFAPYSFHKLRSDSYIRIRSSANIRYSWVQSIYFMKKGEKHYPYKTLKSLPTNKPKNDKK